MSTVFIAMVMIGAVGAIYVVLPVIANTYRRYRGPWMVECPDTDTSAEIAVDATHAALTSAAGAPDVRVRRCSHWPERQGCDQSCLT